LHEISRTYDGAIDRLLLLCRARMSAMHVGRLLLPGGFADDKLLLRLSSFLLRRRMLLSILPVLPLSGMPLSSRYFGLWILGGDEKQ
jgi:hypothetical protein